MPSKTISAYEAKSMSSQDSRATAGIFQFVLRPMDEVQPWGDAGDLSLHWFGLTDGWFFLRLGEAKVLWYDDAACRSLGWENPPAPQGFEGAVDYQVARPFHDLADLLPSILEPVPPDVAVVLSSPEALNAWEKRVEDGGSDDNQELHWVGERTLDCLHLRAGPWITFWRLGDEIRIRSDNRDELIEGTQVWIHPVAEVAIPLRSFVDQAREFGEALLRQMDERVNQVEKGWRREGVALEPSELRRDHAENKLLWESAIRAPHRRTDWDIVRAALR